MGTISQLMTHSVHGVKHTTAVTTCLSMMSEYNIRHLPVLDHLDGLQGVVTDCALLQRQRTGGAVDWVGAVVEPSQTASPDDDALQVIERQLNARRECTVVVNATGQPVGIFTESDALELARLSLKPWRQCAEIMTDATLYLVLPEGEADNSLAFMLEHDIHHLMVVDPFGKLQGVLSHRDLVGRGETPVRSLMSTPVFTAESHTPVEAAVAIMTEHKIGCLPIVGDDLVPMGIVTRTDVLRHLVDQRGKDGSLA